MSDNKALSFSEIARELGAFLRGPERRLPFNVCIDSRKIRKGDLFVAIKGENTDGHRYIPQAVSGGAIAVVAERAQITEEQLDLIDPKGETTFLLVSGDTLKFLSKMAVLYLKRISPREIISVTGSVGKTTTREMLKRILSCKYPVHSPVSSYNTLLGCSLTILAMSNDTEILILEMGTNSPGEILEMASVFRPTIGVITEVTEAHLQGLETIQGVLQAKLEMLRSDRLHSLFYNWDNLLLRNELRKSSLQIHYYGVGHGGGDIRIDGTEFILQEGKPLLTFKLAFPGFCLDVRSGLFGPHQALCLSLALGVADRLGVALVDLPFEDLGIDALPGRGCLHFLKNSQILVIDDSYNANPSSMRAALRVMGDIPWDGRKIAVLGTMKELGKNTPFFHRQILHHSMMADILLLVGEEWSEVVDQYRKEEGSPHVYLATDYREAIGILEDKLSAGDLILVKGSHSNELEQVVSFVVDER